MAEDIVLPSRENLAFWCFWLFVVILLLLWDIWKARKRSAIWIPGGVLVFSSIIIQLLSYVDYSHISIYSDATYEEEEEVAVLKKNQLVIDSGRVMMCVLIAYLLPGMARPGSHAWLDLSTLAFTIVSNISAESQLLQVNKPTESPSASPSPSPSPSPLKYLWLKGSHINWSKADSAILHGSIVELILLMIYAALMGRSTRKIMSQKIPLALSCCCNSPEKQQCKSIGDHVLKCWIVVRASRPDHVIARSFFCPFASFVATYCVVVLFIKWAYFLPHYKSATQLDLLVIMGQFAIILIGWIVVLIRWFKSVPHYSSYTDFNYNVALAGDDITSDLYDSFARQWFGDKRIQEKKIRHRQQLQEERVSKVVKMAIFFYPFKCNVCSSETTDQFSTYKEVLKFILPREKVNQFCISNKWGFDKVKNQLTKGHEKGKTASVELIELLKRRARAGQDQTEISLEAAKDFEQVGRTCWKKIAVLLIQSMIYSYDGTHSHFNAVKNAVQSYIQAWEYMDFSEGLEKNVQLVGREADAKFDDVEDIWKKMKYLQNLSDDQVDEVNRQIEEKIKKPLRDQMEELLQGEREDNTARGRSLCLDNVQENEHWLKVVEKIINGANAMANLQRLLARVLLHCVEKEVRRAIIEKSNNWAAEGMEHDIFDVALLTAKAQAVLDEIYRNDVLRHRGQSSGSGVERAAYDDSQISRDNIAVPPDVAARNNATAADDEENETYEDASETLVDTIAGEITTTVVAENGNNATVPDGEENEPRYGEPLEILVDTIA